MTVQEAIKILNPETSAEALLEIEYYGGFNGKMAQIQAVIDASVIAVECMEKQIPKKVQKLESKILIADGWQYQCPQCKCAVGINQHAEEQTQEDNYCPTCGQALKWGEEDD